MSFICFFQIISFNFSYSAIKCSICCFVSFIHCADLSLISCYAFFVSGYSAIKCSVCCFVSFIHCDDFIVNCIIFRYTVTYFCSQTISSFFQANTLFIYNSNNITDYFKCITRHNSGSNFTIYFFNRSFKAHIVYIQVLDNSFAVYINNSAFQRIQSSCNIYTQISTIINI